jgi:hypothetical protein
MTLRRAPRRQTPDPRQLPRYAFFLVLQRPAARLAVDDGDRLGVLSSAAWRRCRSPGTTSPLRLDAAGWGRLARIAYIILVSTSWDTPSAPGDAAIVAGAGRRLHHDATGVRRGPRRRLLGERLGWEELVGFLLIAGGSVW